jgi:hypothetical protein
MYSTVRIARGLFVVVSSCWFFLHFVVGLSWFLVVLLVVDSFIRNLFTLTFRSISSTSSTVRLFRFAGSRIRRSLGFIVALVDWTTIVRTFHKVVDYEPSLDVFHGTMILLVLPLSSTSVKAMQWPPPFSCCSFVSLFVQLPFVQHDGFEG